MKQLIAGALLCGNMMCLGQEGFAAPNRSSVDESNSERQSVIRHTSEVIRNMPHVRSIRRKNPQKPTSSTTKRHGPYLPRRSPTPVVTHTTSTESRSIFPTPVNFRSHHTEPEIYSVFPVFPFLRQNGECFTLEMQKAALELLKKYSVSNVSRISGIKEATLEYWQKNTINPSDFVEVVYNAPESENPQHEISSAPPSLKIHRGRRNKYSSNIREEAFSLLQEGHNISKTAKILREKHNCLINQSLVWVWQDKARKKGEVFSTPTRKKIRERQYPSYICDEALSLLKQEHSTYKTAKFLREKHNCLINQSLVWVWQDKARKKGEVFPISTHEKIRDQKSNKR